MSELNKETNICSPKSLHVTEGYSLPPTPLTLHDSLTDFDCLFFIWYLPENTLKECCFLVQINHIDTALLDMNSKRTGYYHATFISRHTKDSCLCDDTDSWWPLWHQYKNDRNNDPIYGTYMLFGPKRKPDPNKYIIWTDYVHLSYLSCYLYGTFYLFTLRCYHSQTTCCTNTLGVPFNCL